MEVVYEVVVYEICVLFAIHLLFHAMVPMLSEVPPMMARYEVLMMAQR